MKEIVEMLMLMWRCSWSWREQVIVALCHGKGDCRSAEIENSRSEDHQYLYLM
jgi:hypothetical protein